MIPMDYHMHTSFSTDSETPMEAMIQQAIKLGMKEICFTDHYDINYPMPSPEDNDYGDVTGPLFLFDVNQYTETIDSFQKKYGNQISIKRGIEFGLQDGIEAPLTKLLQDHSFDFCIGSSHLLYGKDPYYPSFWTSKSHATSTSGSYVSSSSSVSSDFFTKQEFDSYVYDYFMEINQNIKRYSGFHVYGHLDYILRYAPCKDIYYSPLEFEDLLTESLRLLIETGRGIELNTSGLKSKLRYPNPHPDILKLYRKLSGEIITIGSDAHTPEYIGYQFDIAQSLLEDCGFQYLTTFEQGKPIFHKIR